jgi:hypothetical protein
MGYSNNGPSTGALTESHRGDGRIAVLYCDRSLSDSLSKAGASKLIDERQVVSGRGTDRSG